MNKEKVIEMVQGALGDVKLDFTTVAKNNDTMMHGVTVHVDNERMSPVIYYNPDDTDEKIAAGVISAYKSAPLATIDVNKIMSKDFILSNVQPVLVNTRKNVRHLTDKVKTKFLDLTIIYKVFIDSEKNMTITDMLLDLAEITKEELHAAAMENLQKRVDIMPMLDVLKSLGAIGDDCDDDTNMIVISTDDRYYGAAAILSHDVLEKVADRFNGDFYVIPSSVHEVLAIQDRGDVDSDSLKYMIDDVNASMVEATERLASHPYYYSRKRGMVAL